MANELQAISSIFEKCLFRVPDYQRGYAWQNYQLQDFWSDLVNLQKDRYHYVGVLSLKNLKEEKDKKMGNDLWILDKGFKVYHVVDGQQRLTSCIILINEIINFICNLDENKNSKENEIIFGNDNIENIISKYIYQKKLPDKLITTYLFGYEIDNPSFDYLKYKIFNEPLSHGITETYYTKNLKNAKEFFKQNIKILYDNEGIGSVEDLYLKLTQKFMFNVHEINEEFDVFVAFETMNNRGKKLSNLELLKNRLIYITTLFRDCEADKFEKESLRSEINDAWKEIYNQLGKNKDISLGDDEFLKGHWIIYFMYSRKRGNDYIEFLLNKFSSKNIFEKNDKQQRLEPIHIKEYIDSLKDMAKYWYDTFFPSESVNLTNEEKIWVDRLNRIGIAYFRPIVASIISRNDMKVEERVKVFKSIESFIFTCFRIGFYNSNYCSSRYYEMARQIYYGDISLIELNDDIVKKINDVREYTVKNFINRIHKYFTEGYGFCSWNSLKYFMFEYEYDLSVEKNIAKITWEAFTKSEKDKVSIEHIFPQTPTKHYWANNFRQFDDEEKSKLAGALGNLLPLSQSINSSLQNDGFDKKKVPENGRRGYKDGSHSEIEVSKEEMWTAENIYNRSEKLLRFMSDRWELGLNEEQIKDLIYIDFAIDDRIIPDEIKNDEMKNNEIKKIEIDAGDDLRKKRIVFWTNFQNYCINNDIDEYIYKSKPSEEYYYQIFRGPKEFHLEYTISYSKYVDLVIYVYEEEGFNRLHKKKNEIEEYFGAELDWHSSRKDSKAKRILFKHTADIFNINKQDEIFAWMIKEFYKLRNALVKVGEIKE